MVVFVLVLGLLATAGPASAGDVSLPPGERPVVVHTGFYLVNLSGLSERSETFEADIHMIFRWHDPRLAFPGGEPKRFIEEAALAQLDRIWWPDVDFVNAHDPDVGNHSLQIFPDGQVEYQVGVSGEFRTDLDLRRFPFDTQMLHVHVESFLWTEDQMIFVPDAQHIGFSRQNTFEGLAVTNVSTDISKKELSGWDEIYSDFVAVIDVERRSAFYVWTVFAPIVLIFLMSCTVFAVDYRNYHDRVGVSLGALLACIATQFAISFNLPQISYLTVIDRVFVATYACVALGVLISVAQATLLRDDSRRAARIDRLAGLGLPVSYFVLIGLCIVA